MADASKMSNFGTSFIKSKRANSSKTMKFHLFHQGGGSVQSITERDEPASLSNNEDDTLDWSSHSSAHHTVSNQPADSDVIIEKVDGMYEEFAVFHTNLKKLLSLYREEHLAMKALNEKRFDVSV
ncbi:hypothetical protein HJC23_013897 [Cyclotella cryptica]|uniref:SPX domain-containing protein n=1 Tax=Cyclotella cryptica TaxID=29204 RepID=A0ABD3QH96_9STRA